LPVASGGKFWFIETADALYKLSPFFFSLHILTVYNQIHNYFLMCCNGQIWITSLTQVIWLHETYCQLRQGSYATHWLI
jgi:hypothetical protein